MAEATSTGIATLDLPGWQERLTGVWSSGLGGEVAFDPETPQGQIIGIDAITWTTVDELLAFVSNGQSLDAAAGFQLDILGTLRGIDRKLATRSTVMATLAGVPAAVIAAGTRAADTAGDAWVLEQSVSIGSGGTVGGTFRAEEFGPVEVAAGELSRIVNPVAGWESLTNALAGTAGVDRETDGAYRVRLHALAARGTQATVEALEAAVRDVDGVTRSRVLENATNAGVTLEGLTIAAGAVMVIAEGGTDAGIGEAVRVTKGLGTPTAGGTSVTVGGTAYNFQRVSTKDLDIDLTITAGAGFPSDGVTRIEDALITWVDSLAIGAALDLGRIYEALNSVPGYTVASLTVRQNPTAPETLVQAQGNEVYALARDDITTTTS